MVVHSRPTCPHCSPGTLIITHAHLDYPLKPPKSPHISLVTRPTSWPCLRPSYAQPKCFHVFAHPFTSRVHSCGPRTPPAHLTHLACMWFLSFTLSHSHKPLTPSVPSCVPVVPVAHLLTHTLHTSLRTPCMPLKLTLPFCSSDVPRHLHIPPHALADPFPLIAHETFTSTTSSTTRTFMSPQ